MISSSYKALNVSFKEGTLIYPLTQRGFASEINNLCLAILYCVDKKIQFKLDSSSWNSGNWEDYFLPFCDNYKGFTGSPDLIFHKSRKNLIKGKLIEFLYSKHTVLDKKIWNEMRSTSFFKKKFYIPELNIDGGIFEAKQKIFSIIYKYNNTIKQQLTELPPKEFAGIHVRRGDKLIEEASLFEVEKYIKIISEKTPHINTIFIASDSYEVVEEFETHYPNYTLVTFIPESSMGHLQKNFNLSTKEQRFANTLLLLKDINFLTRSTIFVGTYSSNIGRLIALLRNDSFSYSVDVDWYAS